MSSNVVRTSSQFLVSRKHCMAFFIVVAVGTMLNADISFSRIRVFSTFRVMRAVSMAKWYN
jgi:hypothetical protein